MPPGDTRQCLWVSLAGTWTGQLLAPSGSRPEAYLDGQCSTGGPTPRGPARVLLSMLRDLVWVYECPGNAKPLFFRAEEKTVYPHQYPDSLSQAATGGPAPRGTDKAPAKTGVGLPLPGTQACLAGRQGPRSPHGDRCCQQGGVLGSTAQLRAQPHGLQAWDTLPSHGHPTGRTHTWGS